MTERCVLKVSTYWTHIDKHKSELNDRKVIMTERCRGVFGKCHRNGH